MYMQERLARERYQETLRKAQEDRMALRIARLRRMERRRQRAERDIVSAWERALSAGQRVDELRSGMS